MKRFNEPEAIKFLKMIQDNIWSIGTGAQNWTVTGLLPIDFKSIAASIYATPASSNYLVNSLTYTDRSSYNNVRNIY